MGRFINMCNLYSQTRAVEAIRRLFSERLELAMTHWHFCRFSSSAGQIASSPSFITPSNVRASA